MFQLTEDKHANALPKIVKLAIPQMELYAQLALPDTYCKDLNNVRALIITVNHAIPITDLFVVLAILDIT